MGGAFTAVADDQSAFYWNPAGIALGSILSAGFYTGQDDRSVGAGGVSDGATGLSLGYTFMGVAFTGYSHDEDFDGGDGALDTFDTAISLLHSLPLDNLILGANVHFLRGTTHAMTEVVSHSWDVDLGVMYEIQQRLRIGLMLRSLREARFVVEGGGERRLPRHARLGVSLRLPADALLAADFDVSSQQEGSHRYRELSFGGEKGLFGGRLYARGGLRIETGTTDGLRPGFSAGAGVSIWRLLLEGAYRGASGGRDDAAWFGVTLAP